MIKKLIFLISLIFFTYLSAASDGTVQGYVRDSNGSALANALVTIYKNQQVHATANTDGTGFYFIQTTPDKKYVITATYTGYQTQSQGLIIEKNQTTTANFSLLPNPGSLTVNTISGAVSLSGVSLVLMQNNVTIATGETVSGSYTFANLAPGSYTIIASKNGYATTTGQAIVVSDATATCLLNMQSLNGSIAGTVSSNGTPIPNVLIELLLEDVLLQSAYTDLSGGYSISGIASGTYTVHAHVDGFNSGVQGATISAPSQTTVNFNLSAFQGTLKGNVQDSQGNNLSGVTITILQNNIIIDTHLSDYYGNYIFSGLLPGAYVVQASYPSYQSQVLGGVVYNGIETSVDFILQPNPANLSGSVKKGSNGIAGATVEVNYNNIVLFSTLTDQSGSYLIESIAPADYVLHVHKNGYQSQIISKTLVSGNNTQNFSMTLSTSGSLQGTVYDNLMTPLSGAVVELNQNNIALYSAVTGNDGSYNFPSVPVGNYIIHCHKPLFQTSFGEFYLTNGINIYDIKLTPYPSRIYGYVNQAYSGSFIGGAFLTLYDNNVFLSTAVSSNDGFYEITGLPPGNYQLFTQAPGYGSSSINFTLGFFTAKQIDITLLSNFSARNGSVTLSNNRYALQTQKVYTLSWEGADDPSVIGYLIYRNIQKIGEVGGNSALSYVDKTPPNSEVVFYQIVSINSSGVALGVLNLFP